MFFAGHPGRNENSQMTHAFVDRVDDRLPKRADLIDILVKIENPAECLRGRRDIVALRAENHDGRANIAQVDSHAVAGLDSTGCQIVAYEQLINNELDLFRVQIDVAAPPALETEVARGFRVNLRIDIVL